jgi:hypothetical protein
MAVLAYLFVVVVFLDAKKTSGVTWEQVLGFSARTLRSLPTAGSNSTT